MYENIGYRGLAVPADAQGPLAVDPGTCDIRLAESTQYSNWTAQLAELGVATNTTININGEDLGSGRNVSLAAFLAQDAQEIRALIRRNVLPAVAGGARTTSLLVVDIEAVGVNALTAAWLVPSMVGDSMSMCTIAAAAGPPR